MSANIALQVIEIKNLDDAKRILGAVGCDLAGINVMKYKAVFKVVRIECLRTKAANLLKQTFLGKGADVAVSRHSADLSAEYTDAVIFATIKQYRMALPQLRQQPWGLCAVAEEIERLLMPAQGHPRRYYEWRDRRLELDGRRSLVMGILNVTPDSFSDGGKYLKMDAALRHAETLQKDGADLIDIGAESTRPYDGARKVSAEEERERLLPILEQILQNTNIPISVDTYKASVADAALRAGAHIVNDIWGLQGDPQMAEVVAVHGVPVVVMHNKVVAEYPEGVMRDVELFLRKSIALGIEKGIRRENIIVDPGIGFAKTFAHNMKIMGCLEQLQDLDCPILLAASRKKMIGQVLDLPPDDRTEGTIAVSALGKMKGVQIHRVHDVKQVKRMLRMLDAMMESGENDENFT